MQTRKRKKSDTQRVPVVGCHSPVFDIANSPRADIQYRFLHTDSVYHPWAGL